MSSLSGGGKSPSVLDFGNHMQLRTNARESGETIHTRCPDEIPCDTKYFKTRLPYAECKSGASTKSVVDNGIPPPRMSSKDGMPEDVRNVDDKKEDVFDPVGTFSILAVALLLKEDMKR